LIKLSHGTNMASANHLMAHGLVAAAARQYNAGGEFWATTDPSVADWFAMCHPASPPAARFEFELPESVLSLLINSAPPGVLEHRSSFVAYEFRPQSYLIVNSNMTGKSIVPVP
jgi:hypothetical protein